MAAGEHVRGMHNAIRREEEDRGGGGWAVLASWAGQAAQERAAQGGKRQVSLFSLLFFFSIF